MNDTAHNATTLVEAPSPEIARLLRQVFARNASRARAEHAFMHIAHGEGEDGFRRAFAAFEAPYNESMQLDFRLIALHLNAVRRALKEVPAREHQFDDHQRLVDGQTRPQPSARDDHGAHGGHRADH